MNHALDLQKEGKTCLIEMMMTKELDDPFRRDAMKMPYRTQKQYEKYIA
jgi:sulfoacetaldehyde acetyltransferase